MAKTETAKSTDKAKAETSKVETPVEETPKDVNTEITQEDPTPVQPEVEDDKDGEVETPSLEDHVMDLPVDEETKFPEPARTQYITGIRHEGLAEDLTAKSEKKGKK